MTDVIVPFVTGLTTGGLSCLAVQGGLLATSIAQQTEKEVQATLAGAGKMARAPKRRRSAMDAQFVVQRHAARPILIFLTAKLAAYTILGFLLGALGSVLQLTPTMRAVIQIAIGVFMLGAALNMLHVHPIFRFFAIEPPKAVTRYIRRVSKHGADDVVTPAFLGALTVLIPCGVTQAMMALAITSGDPISGALILFAFTLGSSPLFFALAYAARKLGQKLEARFFKFAAALVLILALVSIDGGLNLLGSPLSFTSLGEALLSPSNRSVAAPSSAAGAVADADNVMTVIVHPDRYAPSRFTAVAGRPAKLKLITDRTYG